MKSISFLSKINLIQGMDSTTKAIVLVTGSDGMVGKNLQLVVADYLRGCLPYAIDTQTQLDQMLSSQMAEYQFVFARR